jgi:hypothetical protein
MRIALVDSRATRTLYPLGLLKLGAWRKRLGDKCKLFAREIPRRGLYDEIWISTLFTYEIPEAVRLVQDAKKTGARVLVGGIAASLMPEPFERAGAKVRAGLVPEAEREVPDFSLLPDPPEFAITYTSRGCVRKCGFCMVKNLEPEYKNRPEWPQDVPAGAKKIIFNDNNWLAKPIEAIRADVVEIKKLLARGVRKIEFNQALDCRLLTEELADLIAGLPHDPLRFAFDGLQEDGHIQRAVERIVKRKKQTIVIYVLYNFKDSPEDFYYRTREIMKLEGKFKCHIVAFPMRYQPILSADPNREFTGEKWTPREKLGAMLIVSAHSGGRGTLSFTGGNTGSALDEFEYWMGKSPAEYRRLINFPKLKRLVEMRRAKLRIDRAEVRIAARAKANA